MCEECLFFLNLLHNFDSNCEYESSYCCICSGIAIEIKDIDLITDCDNFIENDIPSLI